jgi:DNA repair protein NreA
MFLSTPAEIRKRLEQNWIRYLRENSAQLSYDRINGASPPAVFVGRYGYPKVRVGPMIPPVHGDTSILDNPEQWAGKTTEEIAGYRLALVRGVTALNVNETSGRFIENMQDLAMSHKPVESEAIFEKQPLGEIDLASELRLNTDAAPFGPAAPLKNFKVVASSADRRIESTYYDTDLRASEAIVDLYSRGVQVSQIHKVFSIGMLGGKKTRRLVPTRWSITAIDDIISRNLVDEIKFNSSIDDFEVRQFSHFANDYAVILIPDDVWSFEMIESWFNSDGTMGMSSDYENASGLDHYPTIAGAYFAARLAVAEHLLKRRRKAAALVLREIHPEYIMPLGVWQIREGVREALKNVPTVFEALADAISFASTHLSVSKIEVQNQSDTWKNMRSQKRITDYA